jgi:hypothetical protein
MAGPSGSPESARRGAALWRVAAIYLVVQAISYLVLRLCCSPYVHNNLWIHGALGPLSAVEAVPRFRYHSLPGNVGFVLLSLAILVAPFVHVLRPRRATLVASAVALVVWCLFGMGFAVRHI